MTHRRGGRNIWTAAFLPGAIWAVAGFYPVAVLVCLFFRFPVPMAGYISGRQWLATPWELWKVPAHVLMSVVVYGLFGGAPLLAALGSLGGLVAWRVTSEQPH